VCIMVTYHALAAAALACGVAPERDLYAHPGVVPDEGGTGDGDEAGGRARAGPGRDVSIGPRRGAARGDLECSTSAYSAGGPAPTLGGVLRGDLECWFGGEGDEGVDGDVQGQDDGLVGRLHSGLSVEDPPLQGGPGRAAAAGKGGAAGQGGRESGALEAALRSGLSSFHEEGGDVDGGPAAGARVVSWRAGLWRA
jgi:hypothetical protein